MSNPSPVKRKAIEKGKQAGTVGALRDKPSIEDQILFQNTAKSSGGELMDGLAVRLQVMGTEVMPINPALCVPKVLRTLRSPHKTMYNKLGVDGRAKFLRDCLECGDDIQRLKEVCGWGMFVKSGVEGNEQLKLARDHALIEYRLRDREFRARDTKTAAAGEAKKISGARERFMARITAPGYVMTAVDKIRLRQYSNTTTSGVPATAEAAPEPRGEDSTGGIGSSGTSSDGTSSSSTQRDSASSDSAGYEEIVPRGTAPRGVFAPQAVLASQVVLAGEEDHGSADVSEEAGGVSEEPEEILLDPEYKKDFGPSRRERSDVKTRELLPEVMNTREVGVEQRKKSTVITRESVLEKLARHGERRNRWMTEIEEVPVEGRPWGALAKLDSNELAQIKAEAEIAGILKAIESSTMIAVAIGASGGMDRAILAGVSSGAGGARNSERALSVDARLALAGLGIGKRAERIREEATRAGILAKDMDIEVVAEEVTAGVAGVGNSERAGVEANEDALYAEEAANAGEAIKFGDNSRALKIFREQDQF